MPVADEPERCNRLRRLPNLRWTPRPSEQQRHYPSERRSFVAGPSRTGVSRSAKDPWYANPLNRSQARPLTLARATSGPVCWLLGFRDDSNKGFLEKDVLEVLEVATR